MEGAGRAWTEFTTTGATILMPRLPDNRHQRIRNLESFFYFGYRIPVSRIPRLSGAWNREREALGLPADVTPPWDQQR